MSTVLDAPEALATYMLNGWVLTNRPCPNKGCQIPLMRSPPGQMPEVHFCVSCKPNGPQPESHPYTTSASSLSQTTRASTPATEVSEASNDDDDFIQFVETEETIRRREQTDRASAELGRCLLQGWTMLGDECPNESCYHVPLVRPPKTGGEKTSRKECVLCHQVYTTERDWAGRERLVAVSSPAPAQIDESTISVISPPKDTSSQQASEGVLPPEQPVSLTSYEPYKSNLTAIATTAMIGTLQSSAEALQLSLQILTSRLTSLVSGPTQVDPVSISATAEAISKVTHALSQVKQLQWSETQAHSLT